MSNELHVIFGTGPLGSSIARALVADGKRVKMVSRSGKPGDVANVETVQANVTNLDEARRAAEGASVVYQAAQPAYEKWVTEFPPIQAGVVEAAAANGAKLVVGDNLYMYGPANGYFTEDLPNVAETRKGKVRGQMAEAILAAHQSGKVRAAIGRGSDFYGPAVFGSAVGDRVFYPVLAGKKASLMGNLDLPHTYTYINDFGKGLAILGQRDEALGQIWHIPNAPTVTSREFVNMIYEEAGQTPQMSTLGPVMMRVVGLFIPPVREMIEMSYEFDKPFVVDHSKFERAFGNIATPHREAIRNTLAWFRAHPQTKDKH